MSQTEKHIIVIGGPNGAGKTTSARVLLPRLGIIEFVNADVIAHSLSPENVEGAALSAGRAMLERMNALLIQNRSFAFETTCAGRGHLGFLERAKQRGWRVELFYVWLSSPELAVERVAGRVQEGGHHIPSEVVARRYRNGLANLPAYLALADTAAIYDNSGNRRRLVAAKELGLDLVISDRKVWTAIRAASR